MMSNSTGNNSEDPNLGQRPPQQPYQPATPVPAAAAPLTEAEDRQWASFAHLGGVIGFLPSLIIWLVFKDRGRFAEQEAKEALNFQITITIIYVIGWILTAILIGGLINLAAWVIAIIFSVQGFLKTKDGQAYRYPFALRLIK
ncbi:DUF4870 domain-containing protein [Cryobacterium algoricola]|uniref:DUF4870 domain-containing protein n=1 Tax=Cryobacterium algoricola TaxID=1259183 RepID=A0ABY2IE45_9MICO|nr:DUF4870 domain-containing protein [Cryobacterium algoricola]TFB88180.1 DUF4870 domain-containing protein [Cryobacterium algoricola]